ncbi:MAG TPA: TonB-dependent receptor, partial [Chthoniobacterales bacterium]|nr:TonB-dependent receptor [Chthoniobacterales bacterium]
MKKTIHRWINQLPRLTALLTSHFWRPVQPLNWRESQSKQGRFGSAHGGCKPPLPGLWLRYVLIFVGGVLVSLGICQTLCAQDSENIEATSPRFPLEETQPEPASTESKAQPVVVSATRIDLPQRESPSSISVINSEEIEQKQIERVSDALREVPGLSVVQTGTAGQLTSVFTRGLRSEHTQVLLNGIPINQGLQGAFDFANLTVDNIDRIEVVRGPQSTLYGPRALAGVIQLFTKQGDGTPGVTFSAEGGSYSTAREAIESDGRIGMFDYSVGASRIDTDNARPNNQYRNTAFITDIGWTPEDRVRFSTLITYSLSDAGNPNRIDTPRPIDNLLTEKWMIAPRMEMHVGNWWDHRIIASYDHERQVNDPNQDGFVGPTRAIFERTTFDYQNDIRPVKWVTITSGAFYSMVDAGQKRPFVSQIFGPQPTFISDHTEESAAFLQATARPLPNLILVAGGRFDHFNQFGDIWTWRFAGNYSIDQTGTILHSSVGKGFSPPSSQDKIFGNNFSLEPEEGIGWD